MKFSQATEEYINELLKGAEALYLQYIEEERKRKEDLKNTICFSIAPKLRDSDSEESPKEPEKSPEEILKEKEEQKKHDHQINRDLLEYERENDWTFCGRIQYLVCKLLQQKTKGTEEVDKFEDLVLAPSFGEMLLDFIHKKGLENKEVYHAARVDRKLFSKIISNHFYKPSKQTAISFCLALQLDIEETYDLLATAGYLLSRSCKSDVIVEYFIRTRNYNLDDLNEVLYRIGEHPFI